MGLNLSEIFLECVTTPKYLLSESFLELFDELSPGLSNVTLNEWLRAFQCT